MKWIGQHIWSLVSRFRSDVYLEKLTSTHETSVLVADSNGKVSRRLTVGGGDITGVSVTTDSGGGSKAEYGIGNADFSVLGANGVGVTNSSATITVAAVPGEIDHDSLNNFVAAEHVDWAGASAGTIHSSNVPTLNQDTSGTAAGLSVRLPIGVGGTGQSTAQAAINALAGSTGNGRFLRGNGTNVVMSGISASDLGDRYSTSYLVFLCDTDAFVSNQYITVSGTGISNHAWNTDTDLDYTGANARTIGHADAHISMNAIMLTASIIIPQACQLMGFYAIARNEISGNAGPAPFGFGIFHTAEANVNFGSAIANVTGNNTILRAYGISPDTGNEKKHQKIDAMLATPFDLAEGDVLTPTAWGATGDQVKGTITLVLRTLVE